MGCWTVGTYACKAAVASKFGNKERRKRESVPESSVPPPPPRASLLYRSRESVGGSGSKLITASSDNPCKVESSVFPVMVFSFHFKLK